MSKKLIAQVEMAHNSASIIAMRSSFLLWRAMELKKAWEEHKKELTKK